MVRLVKAEYIKGRRSFGRKSLVLFPLLVSLMAVMLMGGQFTQVGAYNWWYIILLPTVVALICINLTAPEKRMNFFNIAIIPVSGTRIWRAKVLTGCLYIMAANLLVFGLTTISGIFFNAQYPVWRGMSAAVVLTITWLWQIPLGMFLSIKFSSVTTLLGILGINTICCIQDIAGGSLWVIPFAIPARLMAPIIGVNPNGIPLSADSPLHNPNVILPGLFITAVLFMVSLLLTTRWFNDRGERYENAA